MDSYDRSLWFWIGFFIIIFSLLGDQTSLGPMITGIVFMIFGLND